MDVSINETWCRQTQGYKHKTTPPRDGKYSSPGRSNDKTSLCLGGGIRWDKAEAARVAAEEARRDRQETDESRTASTTPLAKQTSRGSQRRNPSPLRAHPTKHTYFDPMGWLSMESRSNKADLAEKPKPNREVLDGPYDVSRFRSNLEPAANVPEPTIVKSPDVPYTTLMPPETLF